MTLVNAAWRSLAASGLQLPTGEALAAWFRVADAAAAARRRLPVWLECADIHLAVARGQDGSFWLTAADPAPSAAAATDALGSPVASPPPDRRLAANAERSAPRRERLAAVGQLAGGVAHDFNNLLTAIGLQADELLQRRPPGDPDHDNLAQIRATVARAASLANQLLTFASRAPRRREILDLGQLIGDLEVLLRRLLREDMSLAVEIGEDLPSVLADPAQLETVFVNLVVNARDAIGAAGIRGGQVRVRAARVDRAEAKRLGHEAAEGDMALLEVSDNGPGIAPSLIETIFDPFFTTKPRGEGTGLGLSTVYGVVQQSEGWIGVRPAQPRGARFVILLPQRHRLARLEPLGPAAAAAARPRDLSGAGRILLVEDEEIVRRVAARLLRGRGYEVLEAADGEAALELARRHPGEIALLISDVVMPGLDGPSLLRAARPHLGPIPVLFISGYAESEFSRLLEAEPTVGFIAKPLDFKTLAERVKLALRASASP